MTGITSNVGKSTRQLAQDIAQKMSKEPWEILKTAGSQVAEKSQEQVQTNKEPSPSDEAEKLNQKDKTASIRQIEALEKELADIEKDKLLKELQRKIAQGEEVYLEEYPQLSPDQKQVLQAQIEAVKARNQQLMTEKPLQEPAFRKGRRLFSFGQKSQAERQKTRVERPLPPSG